MSTKALQKLTYEKKGNLIFFLYIFPLALLPVVFTAAIPYFWGTKGKKEGEENGGGRSTPALLLQCGWRIQSLLAFLQNAQPTNTFFFFFLKWKRRRGRCERRREGGPGEKWRDTDRQANRLTETECQGQKTNRENERKKVGDIDSEMSKW